MKKHPNKIHQTIRPMTIKKRKKKVIIPIFIIAFVVIVATAIGVYLIKKEEVPMEKFDANTQMVVIEMENGDLIKVELYPDQAPITVNNFVKLVREGFYDGLVFHRIIPGFMIQGGDGSSVNRKADSIKGEFSSNGVENNIKHVKGVLSMARTSNRNSASSQFFIMDGEATHLDGEYAAFGKVIEGFENVDKIVAVDCDTSNPNFPVPLVPQVIKKMTIEPKD